MVSRMLAGALVVLLAGACTFPDGLASTELAVPSCAGDVCTEGVDVHGEFFALTCWGVDSTAVADEVVASGSGVFQEVRPITGLPRDQWLAVKGDLPCQPASGAPLEYEWYLLESPELTVEERREHLAVFRAVTTEP
ncbi:MAG TPA: hypothetical protein VJ820_08690 [Propionibacteriaceae bacterium]|nr:hypothetical protein [Propionibacteriaceae bacterium]